MLAILVATLCPLFLGVPSAQAQESLRGPATRGYVTAYKKADHWALKSIALVTLGERWHPDGVEIVLDALQSKQEELRAFAVEQLLHSEPAVLRHVASLELVDELVKKQLKNKHELYASRVEEVLRRLFPTAGAEGLKAWRKWWAEARKTYAPAPWVEPGETEGELGSVAANMIERAFDLNEAGLEVVICIDSTGSMQTTIDAARDGLGDIITLLKGISPKLKLGLVHYKDFDDMSGGAGVLEKLTPKTDSIQKKLGSLTAYGGGDIPERIEGGLEAAYGKKMGWSLKANKVVIVIGDAPAHKSGLPRAVELAEQAFRKPFGREPKAAPASGSRRTTTATVRPFVTSTIGVGLKKVPTETAESMKKIAEAGGGAYGTLLTESEGKASTQIVKHLLIQAFGSRYAKEAERFVEIYLEYHRAGFI